LTSPSFPLKMDGSLTPKINSEWIYETYHQQQQTNAVILETLRELRSQSHTPLSALGHTEPEVIAPAVVANTFRPKHSLPQPEYTHEDPSLYPQFRGLLAQKLRIDALACGDSEYDRVWYGFACLKGIAASRIFPWIDYAQKVGASLTIQGFLTQLDTAFSDPQKAQKAITKINKIRQGRRNFREFLHEFEQTLLEASGWGWDDVVRKGYLKVSINYKLRSLLVSQAEPPTYTAYVDLLRLTSDNLEALEHSSWHSRPPSSTQPQPMDWQPTSAARTGVFVSKDIQEKRQKANKCIKCGGTGHYARGCRKGWSLPQKQSPIGVNAARESTRVTSAIEGTDSESGKE
jgi:hypothetical protein